VEKNLVETWLKRYPVLGEFDEKLARDSPNPLVLLELIPNSFGEQLLTKWMEKPLELKRLEIENVHNEFHTLPCTLVESEKEAKILVTNHDYKQFLIALGLYAWKHLLSLEDRKNYALIVNAMNSNYLFEKEEGKEVVSPENSTWLHFARNVQNVIAMRPLEFVKHRKKASRSLLEFFKEKGIIDENHYKAYLEKLGRKRAIETGNREETAKLIESNKYKHVDKKKALELLEYVQNLQKQA